MDKPVQFFKDGGSSPESLFLNNFNTQRRGDEHIDQGISPDRLLLDKSMMEKAMFSQGMCRFPDK